MCNLKYCEHFVNKSAFLYQILTFDKDLKRSNHPGFHYFTFFSLYLMLVYIPNARSAWHSQGQVRACLKPAGSFWAYTGTY